MCIVESVQYSCMPKPNVEAEKKRKTKQNKTTVTIFWFECPMYVEANEWTNERKNIKINDASKTFPQIIAFEALTKWREKKMFGWKDTRKS